MGLQTNKIPKERIEIIIEVTLFKSGDINFLDWRRNLKDGSYVGTQGHIIVADRRVQAEN